VEDSNGEAIKKHLARVPDYLWLSEDGITLQVHIVLDFMFEDIFIIFEYYCD